MTQNVISLSKKGIFCKRAQVYIDPWKSVDSALITHAHADHARSGHKQYFAHKDSEVILRLRLGNDINVKVFEYNEPFKINDVTFSLHPAGHIVGSAQVRVEYNNEVWVITGDYKLQNDNVSEPFELVTCDYLISECTFGLPIYKWKKQSETIEEINQWWMENQNDGKNSVLISYSLGKAQRILKNIDVSIGPIFTHGAVQNINDALISRGHVLPNTIKITKDVSKKDIKGSLVIAPQSVNGTNWLNRLKPYSLAFASGWMQVAGRKRRGAYDRGFVISDHADWNGLLKTIKNSNAKKVFLTHGYSAQLSRYLREVEGIDAEVLETQFAGEEE